MDRTPRTATVRTTLTVYFEDPFWVGVFERLSDAGLEAGRVVFGAEPTGVQLYAWMLQSYPRDVRYGPPVRPDRAAPERPPNPKRMQREIARATGREGLSTKAQEALKAALEARKEERRVHGKAEREAHAQRLFELKQEKRKQKHRGH